MNTYQVQLHRDCSLVVPTKTPNQQEYRLLPLRPTPDELRNSASQPTVITFSNIYRRFGCLSWGVGVPLACRGYKPWILQGFYHTWGSTHNSKLFSLKDQWH